MSRYLVRDAKLVGCSVVLGEQCHHLIDSPHLYQNNSERLERLQQIGLKDRYVANPETTTADLCTQAAQSLLEALGVPVNELGAIISVTQTPDYRMPGNAHVIHARLGCKAHTASLDLTMGCSGFVYGLWVASAMVSTGKSKVLFVAGDVLNRQVGQRDTTVAPLFSDSGSATLVDLATEETMAFVLKSDGRGIPNLHVPAGGARMPSSDATREEVLCDDGNYRSAEQLFMDGMEIFRFSVVQQPRLIKELLDFTKTEPSDIDYFFLHQANSFIVESIAKKTGIDSSRMPSWVFSRYGNQNSASLPGVLCAVFGENPVKNKIQVVLQGYGTGLSWGACELTLEQPLCLPAKLYAKD